MRSYAMSKSESKSEDIGPSTPMKRLVERLMANSPPLVDASGTPVPDQVPAIECVVMFACGQTVRGSLSTTQDGLLRMLSPGTDNDRPVLVEQFFSYAAVATLALVREIRTEARRIVVPAGARS